LSSTRTIYARVFAPDPQHEAEGKYVRVMIYEGEDQAARAKSITFAENTHPVAFTFFSQFDDHYMRLG
jgi:hypothetical protein